MLLIDKGFFDYDYVQQEENKFIDWESTVKTQEELHDLLAGFGFGLSPKKPETIDEIQEHIIKQESYGS